MVATINLNETMGAGRVHNLAGRERGVAVRERYELDRLDATDGEVVIHIPDQLYSVSDSFILGMLAPSVLALGGLDAFLDKYRFEGEEETLRHVMRGLERATAGRGRLVLPSR